MACKILYVGYLSTGENSLYRYETLQRLGQQMVPFNVVDYNFKFAKLNAIRFRYPIGFLISKINADLVAAVAREKPDVVWFDKPLFFTPTTVQRIKDSGALTVCFNADNPFGPRKDGCWHQFMKIFRMIDLHCLLRYADVSRFENWGLNYIKLQLSYDPQHHFPPPEGWSDQDQTRGVSYIGHPYEERPSFLRTLIEREKLPVVISGNGWRPVITGEERERYTRAGILQDAEGMLKDGDYREAIWKSKINLSFVTHTNEDDMARKSIEIAGCGGFLLAVRCSGHVASFEEGKEAEFFSTVEECAQKSRYYLDHPAERLAIARRGLERAERSGYSNDALLGRAMARLEEMRAARASTK